ncbi:MAG: hypothetical protein RIR65_2101 [Planctomycetota bacterium]
MNPKNLLVLLAGAALACVALYFAGWRPEPVSPLTSAGRPTPPRSAELEAPGPELAPVPDVAALRAAAAATEAPLPAQKPWEVDDDLKTLGAETDHVIIRRRLLTSYLHEFRRCREKAGAMISPYEMSVRQLHLMSLATLLEAQGRYAHESTIGTHKGALEDMKAAAGADNMFMMNDRVFLFRKGEFPEYDRAIEHSLAVTAERRARNALDILDWRGHLDAAYFDAIEARAIEALTSIYSM